MDGDKVKLITAASPDNRSRCKLDQLCVLQCTGKPLKAGKLVRFVAGLGALFMQAQQLPEHKGSMLSSLQDPLREYALEHLPAVSLARLRSVSKAAQRLVDYHTGSIWKAAATALLDPACLPGAEHADAVQARLEEERASLQNLLQDILAGEELVCERLVNGWSGNLSS